MATSNRYILNVDIKQRMSNKTPMFVQYDNAELVFRFYDRGKPFDLSEFDTARVTHRLPSGKSIIGNASFREIDGVLSVYYPYQGSEMAEVGTVLTSVSLFVGETQKVSILPFNVEIVDDLFSNISEGANQEYGLLQDLLTDVRNLNYIIEENEERRNKNEQTRQTQEQTRQSDTSNAIQRLDTAIDSSKLIFKSPVATKSALSTTYSNPEIGWVAQVTTGADAGKFFRWNGSSWEYHSEIALDAVTDIQNRLSRTDRKTETLIDGVNIIDAPVGSPAEIEIRGRTMSSLGNSNLDEGKYYAVTDNKYKVETDGKTIDGVGKFQKEKTHTTTANFDGKKRGDMSIPHIAYGGGSFGELRPPNSTMSEYSNNRYYQISARDYESSDYGYTGSADNITQNIFSFNVVAQVERDLGVIPGNTTAEKSAWLRTNAEELRIRWYGYGVSPQGNKAYLLWWNGTAWSGGSAWTHTDSTPTEIVLINKNTLSQSLQDDGFAHYMVHTDPSDGVTEAHIYTDYIENVITLKTTARLNTRPTVVRIENFDGKEDLLDVSVNPHIAYIPGNAYHENTKGLMSPIGGVNLYELRKDHNYANYEKLTKSSIEPLYATIPGNERGVGGISQTIFSFNIVEAVERNIGKIPATTKGEKVEWVRNNISKIRAYWTGRGRGSESDKASFAWYRPTENQWVYPVTHNNPDNTRVVRDIVTSVYRDIDDNGFVHYIAYASPADLGNSSTIYTDYIEIEISVKPTADFRQPKVPLYEVSKEEYDRIGVVYSEDETRRRYPVIQGTQHLVNPYVESVSENLAPPFTDPRWDIHPEAKVISPTELFLETDGTWKQTAIDVPALPNTRYTVSTEGDTPILVRVRNKDGNSTKGNINQGLNKPLSFSFTTDTDTRSIQIVAYGTDTTGKGGKFTYKNISLVYGDKKKPFTPYNPTTLHAPLTMMSGASNKDTLYKKDGRWYFKNAMREIELTGEQNWIHYSHSYDGFHRFRFSLPNSSSDTQKVVKYNGSVLQTSILQGPEWGAPDLARVAGSEFYITVSVIDSGFPQDFAPDGANIKRYFNGWRYTDGTTWESVTGNGQTATAEEAIATIPDDYTPYKLIYELYNPQTIDVTENIEGDIIVSGLNFVEVGAGEIVTEDENGNRTYTRISDREDYSVTASPNNIKITYEQNIRSSHDALVAEVSDNSSLLSIHERAIVNLFARIRGLELSADEIRQDLDDLRTDFDNLPEPTPPTDGGTV